LTLEIRVARPDEYQRVGELTVAAYRALSVDHLWGGYDEGILDTAGRAKGAEILVAVVDDTVVGAVTYVSDSSSSWSEWTQPGEAQFRLLAVAPSARPSGAGRALAEACIERARAAGQPLIIHTTPWMPVARDMYERMGFVRTPDRDVLPSEWNNPPIDGLPPEWEGQSFLAYMLFVPDPPL
jgi:GNAT superfamily N-acetyltransferase